MIQKLKSIQAEVEALLRKADKYRDNDALLVAAYYYYKCGSNLNSISAVEFLQLIVSGSLPFPDSITRLRRKLQEKHPELRGKVYYRRQNAESEVRRGIHDL